MKKKTWIKIKRGLLDPKHREKIGIRIWLYMHIIDRADWSTGIIYEWRDKEEADDLCMPWKTLQQQRQQLEKDGYIVCRQRKGCQQIAITNWTNPREYSGEVYNKSTNISVPLDVTNPDELVPLDDANGTNYDTESLVPLEFSGTNNDTNNDTNNVSQELSTIYLRSQITDHRSLNTCADENFEKETTDDLMNGLTTVNDLLQNSANELWQGKELPEELQGLAYRKNGGASKNSSAAAEPGLSSPTMSREDIARTRAAQALANGMARVSNNGDSAKIESFLGRVPEHIRPLAKAYCECVQRPPVKEEESRWRSAWKTQYELHLTPEDVTNTYNKMMREGLTVASPASVTGIADSDRRKSIFDTQNKCSEADDSRAKRMPDSLDRFRIGNKVFDRADVLAMTDDEWAVAQGNAIYEDMMAHCGPIEETG